MISNLAIAITLAQPKYLKSEADACLVRVLEILNNNKNQNGTAFLKTPLPLNPTKCKQFQSFDGEPLYRYLFAVNNEEFRGLVYKYLNTPFQQLDKLFVKVSIDVSGIDIVFENYVLSRNNHVLKIPKNGFYHSHSPQIIDDEIPPAFIQNLLTNPELLKVNCQEFENYLAELVHFHLKLSPTHDSVTLKITLTIANWKSVTVQSQWIAPIHRIDALVKLNYEKWIELQFKFNTGYFGDMDNQIRNIADKICLHRDLMHLKKMPYIYNYFPQCILLLLQNYLI